MNLTVSAYLCNQARALPAPGLKTSSCTMTRNPLSCRFIPLFAIPVLLLFSCEPREPKIREDILLQVNLSNTLGLKWIYLSELETGTIRLIDSFDVRKTGRHTFRLDPGTSGFYLLNAKSQQYITLLLSPGEQVSLFADGKKWQKSWEVKGSPGSLLLKQYFDHTASNLAKIDSLRKDFLAARYRDDFAGKRKLLDSTYYQIYRDQKHFVERLVRSDCGSIAGVFLLNQRFGPKVIFSEETDLQLFEFIDSCLMQQHAGNKHAISHHERLSRHKRKMAEKMLAEERLAPGQEAPLFNLPDIKGNIVKLESFRGKQVLLYFWTITSARARKDHQELKGRYPSLKAGNTEILAVSLDENRDLWEAAVKLDALPWINLTDTQGKQSPLLPLYALDTELPVYFLIDPEGKILGKSKQWDELISISNL